jgi:dTDP-4-amino-4,6-dideoxygalactose transaminase
MVISAGGVPIFADTEKKSGNIDPGKIEQLIDDNIGAVLITHLHGISASALEILSICQKHQLPLIEDTAQALGAKEDNKFLGTIGTVGVFSFGMYKNINCWYGGAVVSNDKVLIDKIRNDLEHYNYSSAWFIFKRILKGLVTDLLTTPIFFRLFIFWVFRYGFLNNIRAINKWMETELDLKLHNTIPSHYLTRLTPWQARLVLLQLDKIEIHKQSRVVRAKMYYEGLKDLDGLVLPKDINNSSNSYLSFPIQYYDRNKLLKWLMLNNRDIAAQHFKNCADLPDFHAYHRDCPVARKTATEMILLPTYPRYPISEVKKNIKVIRSFFTETGDK